MNALIYWNFMKFKEDFVELCNRLDIAKCFYYYEEHEWEGLEHERFQGIYSYNTLEHLMQNTGDLYPLDETIISKMREYEMTALDIIYRWRRSITSDESYASLRSVYFKYLEFWNDFIIKNKIGFYMLTFEPHIPMTYFPYALCKVYNIPVIIRSMLPLIQGKRVNCFLRSDIKDLGKSFEKRYEENKKRYALKQTPVELPENLEMYFQEYSNKNDEVKRVILFNARNTFLDLVKSYWFRGIFYIKQRRIKILLKKFIYLTKIRRLSKPILNYALNIEEPMGEDEKFFVFFLHLQPENTTLPLGGVYVDQMLVIKLLSKCLPEGYYLYVKEHPAYWKIKERREGVWESRSIEFYKEIKKMKNVRLIAHDINSLSLMDKCRCVVTVTGTAGFEALFKGRPVMVFGGALYGQYENVYNVRSFEECMCAVEDIISGKWDRDERGLRIFLKTLEPNIVFTGIDDRAYHDNSTPSMTKEDVKRYIEKVVGIYRNIQEGSC